MSVVTVQYQMLTAYPGYRFGDDGSVWTSYRAGVNGRRGGASPTSNWFIRKTRNNNCGYTIIGLRVAQGQYVTRYVHQLILEAFVSPRPPGLQVRHLNGVRSDNRLTNLRWGTWQENHEDKLRHAAERERLS